MLRNLDFRRFWFGCAITGFGQQVSNLAIPLTAVLLLHATPAQMGLLVALEVAPFALFSLPAGVWLDRRSKFPILLWSQFFFPLLLASIPLAYWLGILSMPWLYAVGFMTGIGFVVGGSATQVFLTHLVGREQLMDAHSKFAATDSAARLIGPGIAGVLIQWLTAPFAILVDAAGFLVAWWALCRIGSRDARPAPTDAHPLRDMIDGLVYIRRHAILWPLAWGIALWQVLFNGYMALQVLFAMRELNMTPGMLGTMQMLGGLGVLASALLLKPMSKKFGTGVTMLLGQAGGALSWLLLPMIPAALFGSMFASAIAYGIVMFLFDCSTMLLIMPYIVLRQKVTPDAFLGRMTATMRFITVAAAPLGALTTGWIAEHLGVRTGLAAVAGGGMVLMLTLLWFSPLRHIRDE